MSICFCFDASREIGIAHFLATLQCRKGAILYRPISTLIICLHFPIQSVETLGGKRPHTLGCMANRKSGNGCYYSYLLLMGVARGCIGCTCTPRAEKKWGGGVIYLQNKYISRHLLKTSLYYYRKKQKLKNQLHLLYQFVMT